MRWSPEFCVTTFDALTSFVPTEAGPAVGPMSADLPIFTRCRPTTSDRMPAGVVP